MRNTYLGIALVLVGVFILLDHLDVVDFGDILHYGWPLILVAWGISILTRHPQETPAGSPGTPQPAVDTDLLHQSAVFGSLHVAVTATNFKGGSLSTVFGDCVVDLSKCAVAAGDHELRVHGVFGNTTIVLPKDAAATIAARAVFGSVAVMGQRQEGISSDLSWTSDTFAASTSKMRISINRVFGEVRVS